MNYIFLKERTYEIPSHWNELTGKQLVQLMPVVYNLMQRNVGLLRIFQILSGWSAFRIARITGMITHPKMEIALASIWWSKKYDKYFERANKLMEAIESCTSFLLDEDQMNLTENKLPFYKGFYGPSHQLSNMRMAEFAISEMHYLQWKRSEMQGIDHLNNLVATLYRPKRSKYDHKANTDADHREIYNPNLTPAYVKKIEKWSLDVRLAIVTFYEGARKEKLDTNPEIFAEDQGGDPSLFGLWSLMRQVAIKGHFGDFDKVQDQYIDTILMELHEIKAEADKLEEQKTRTNE